MILSPLTTWRTAAPRCSQRLDGVGEFVGDVQVSLSQQRWAADGVGDAVDGCLDAATGEGAKLGRLGDRAPFSCGGDDGSGEWVLAVGLDTAGDTEQLGLVDASGGGDADDDVFATGQGAGLVEQHGVDGPAGLEGEAVLDEDPVAGTDRAGQRGSQRDGQAEGVRAGDHEHGDDSDDCLVGVAE